MSNLLDHDYYAHASMQDHPLNTYACPNLRKVIQVMTLKLLELL